MHRADLTIGQVARLTGVGVEALRFYEREGLIPAPPRRASGYRQYPSDIVARLRFITQAKALGFTLAEIKTVLSLRIGRGARCADVKRTAEEKIRAVEAKIADLQRIRQALKKLAAQCRGKGPMSACPIVENLESEGGAL